MSCRSCYVCVKEESWGLESHFSVLQLVRCAPLIAALRYSLVYILLGAIYNGAFR